MTLSTDQPSRRPPHRKKCTRIALSVAIQAQVTPPSLGAYVSSRTIRRSVAEGHLGSPRPLRVLPLTTPIDISVWSGATHKETGLQWTRTMSSLATNTDSISARVTIVFVCGDPVVNAAILPLLYSETPLPQPV
ncbi:HTH_Tnp_Tc3_2 domain-containing protein [Trichonephila clavipes]|nr:HTH_Tnp_Tc3_2 domain-containing protein [Trichonephila clavipes]